MKGKVPARCPIMDEDGQSFQVCSASLDKSKCNYLSHTRPVN
jgi:hypothetical protein